MGKGNFRRRGVFYGREFGHREKRGRFGVGVFGGKRDEVFMQECEGRA